MASKEYSVISITEDGRQLNGHGYTTMTQIRSHLSDRLKPSGQTVYSLFVIVCTLNDGFATTTCHHLTRTAAQRLVNGR